MPLMLFFVIYQIAQLAALPIILVICALKIREPFNKQRLGFVTRPPQQKKTVWFHAASVGEVLSLQYLIREIEQHRPEQQCYITVNTVTAYAVAQKFMPAEQISLAPYDFLLCILLAHYRIKPTQLFIVESELWPNLIIIPTLLGTRLYSLNTKIGAKSSRLLRWLSPLLSPLLQSFSTFFAQNERVVQQLRQQKVAPEKIVALGNLKAYNTVKKYSLIRASTHNSLPYPVLLIGSLHPGELSIYLQCFKELKKIHPHLKVILAPRHFSWIKELQSALEQASLSYHLWQEDQHSLAHNLAQLDQQDILVVAVLGHLFDLYHYATIFCLGGTFVPIGGHNLLEPAAWGIPTIIGPYYNNCKAEADALTAHHALIKVTNACELQTAANKLLSEANYHRAIGHQAQLWLNNQAGEVATIIQRELFNAS